MAGRREGEISFPLRVFGQEKMGVTKKKRVWQKDGAVEVVEWFPTEELSIKDRKAHCLNSDLFTEALAQPLQGQSISLPLALL